MIFKVKKDIKLKEDINIEKIGSGVVIVSGVKYGDKVLFFKNDNPFALKSEVSKGVSEKIVYVMNPDYKADKIVVIGREIKDIKTFYL